MVKLPVAERRRLWLNASKTRTTSEPRMTYKVVVFAVEVHMDQQCMEAVTHGGFQLERFSDRAPAEVRTSANHTAPEYDRDALAGGTNRTTVNGNGDKQVS